MVSFSARLLDDDKFVPKFKNTIFIRLLSRIGMSEVKKYLCQNCGAEISKEEYETNDGLRDVCQWEEEDDDLIISDDLF